MLSIGKCILEVWSTLVQGRHSCSVPLGLGDAHIGQPTDLRTTPLSETRISEGRSIDVKPLESDTGTAN